MSETNERTITKPSAERIIEHLDKLEKSVTKLLEIMRNLTNIVEDQENQITALHNYCRTLKSMIDQMRSK